MKRQKKHIYFSWIITLVIVFNQVAFLPLHQCIEEVHKTHLTPSKKEFGHFQSKKTNHLPELKNSDFQNDHCSLCDYFFAQVSFIDDLKIKQVEAFSFQPEPYYAYFFISKVAVLDNSRAPPTLFS